MVEKDIIKALFYQDRVAGTTVVLSDYHQSPLPTSRLTKKKFKPANISTRATHDIHQEDSCVQVDAASGMFALETINILALHQCGRNPEMPPSLYTLQHEMTVCRLSGRMFTTPKPPLFIKDVPPVSVSAATGSISISSSHKAAAFQRAFEGAELFVKQALLISTSDTE